MRRMAGRTVLILGAITLLAACGGGATNTTPGGGSTSGPVSTPAAATPAAATNGVAATSDAGQPSPDATSEAPAASASTGGGAGGDVCGLVSVAEMEGLFGVSGVTQQLFAGPPDTCDYRLADAPFVAMVLTPFSAGPVFDAMAADGASTQLDGIGDRALYNSQMLTFLVQKGDALLTIQVLDESRSEEERLGLMKQIGATAAGRM